MYQKHKERKEREALSRALEIAHETFDNDRYTTTGLNLKKQGLIGVWNVVEYARIIDEILRYTVSIYHDGTNYYVTTKHNDGSGHKAYLNFDKNENTFYEIDSEYGKFYKIDNFKLLIGDEDGIDEDCETTYIQ